MGPALSGGDPRRLPERSSQRRPGLSQKRVSDLDRLTNDVAIQFFGVNISCAQCHDHPNVPHWTQASYYGMKSFFSATFDNGGFVAERSEGEVTYKNTRGETLEASLQFFDRPPIEETLLVRLDDEGRKKEKERLEQLKKEKKPASLPSSSRRKLLVQEDWPMHKVVILPARPSTGSGSNSWEEDWLSRSTKCMEPIPQPIQNCFSGFPNGFSIMGTTLGSSLLPWSTDQTYQRSSQWLTDSAPPNESFARFIVRPLTPRQYASALHLASSDPHDWLALSSDSPEHAKHLTQTMKGIDGTTQWFERTSDQVHFAVDEALQMSNASELEAMLHAQEAKWIEACALHEPSNKALNLVFRHILQRSPTLNEQEHLLALWTLSRWRYHSMEGLDLVSGHWTLKTDCNIDPDMNPISKNTSHTPGAEHGMSRRLFHEQFGRQSGGHRRPGRQCWLCTSF